MLLESFLARIVGLDGLGNDGAGGVPALVVLRLGGDRPRDVAGRHSQPDCDTSHDSRRDRDDDFVDLLFAHNDCFLSSIYNINSQRGYCPSLAVFVRKKFKKMIFYSKSDS